MVRLEMDNGKDLNANIIAGIEISKILGVPVCYVIPNDINNEGDVLRLTKDSLLSEVLADRASLAEARADFMAGYY